MGKQNIKIHDKESLEDYSFRKVVGISSTIDKLDVINDFDETASNIYDKHKIERVVFGVAIIGKPRGATASTYNGRLLVGYDRKRNYIISVRIPFRGDRKLFFVRPETINNQYQFFDGEIGEDFIAFEIEIEDLSAEYVNALIKDVREKLEYSLGLVHIGLGTSNVLLKMQIENFLRTRINELEVYATFINNVGINISEDAELLMSIVKTPIPEPPTTLVGVSLEEARKIYTLGIEEFYDDVIQTLWICGQSFQRKPSLYIDRGEDDLRDMFLLFLETRYTNTSGTGETFNGAGKTDILLKYQPDGTNVFIAECKIWRGRSKVKSEMDQLLKYLTYGDVKSSLIFFVKEQNLASIIAKAKEGVEKHPNFKRFIGQTNPTSTRYELTLPQDSEAVITMELIFFHFYDSSQIKEQSIKTTSSI